jgi:hypothetical protein
LDILRDEPMSQPDLLLACGVLEKELNDKNRAEKNLGRWLAAYPNAPQARSVRDLLDGRPLADAAPTWGLSPGRPGSAGCSMQ